MALRGRRNVRWPSEAVVEETSHHDGLGGPSYTFFDQPTHPLSALMFDIPRLLEAHQTARRDLLAQRVREGHWTGELSSSALSTATAVSALAIIADRTRDASRRRTCRQLVQRGIQWLAGCQRADGGWGDTDKSFSNISTAMLVRAAFHLAGVTGEHQELLGRVDQYIDEQGGVTALRRRYGKDKTFAIPILTNAALAGLVPWNEVSPLPFELACLPRALFRLLRLPVVSYAIPALVAIGQARFLHESPRNPIRRLIRRLSVGRSLKVLGRMQPASGGFLEAIPLTSFVTMSLAATGRVDHDVVRQGLKFLLASMREDGSWPIDTNLATWNTTLATNALAAASGNVGALGCLDWLLSCQHTEPHPYTGAAPGGWGWSNLSGAVPDVDDTAGALLALASLRDSCAAEKHERIEMAARAGARWLLEVQNADGGWPTFCRGWGTLPFDRSGADLSAHAIRALAVWSHLIGGDRIGRAIARGMKYLGRVQRENGSWVPLWFGNQYHPDEENPVYGTARVLLAYRDLDRMAASEAQGGLAWLAANSGHDGGWGGETRKEEPSGEDHAAPAVSSVEETAVAVEALLGDHENPMLQTALSGGLDWLTDAIDAGRHQETAPIGFYFAKLWYYERLYPLTFTVAALGRAVRQLDPKSTVDASRRLP